jgi:hypothetical protein
MCVRSTFWVRVAKNETCRCTQNRCLFGAKTPTYEMTEVIASLDARLSVGYAGLISRAAFGVMHRVGRAF